ncbi:MAG: hypothetical protein U0235_04300 [Polyangiaceae bacterium]
MSTVASIRTGHWFATPFAALFAAGYGYVASLVVSEQIARRRAAETSLADSTPSLAPVSSASIEEELAA